MIIVILLLHVTCQNGLTPMDLLCYAVVHAHPPWSSGSDQWQMFKTYITAGLPPAYWVSRQQVSDDGVAPPKSSVRPLADRKPRPTASFVPATVLFYSIRYSQQCFTHHEQITVRVHQGHLILNLKSDTGFPFYRRQNAESTMTSKSMQPVSKAVYGKMSSISLSAPHLTDSVN